VVQKEGKAANSQEMIRVFLVDNEPALLDLAKIYLEREGDFHVATARNAVEARRQLKKKSVDAIVSEAVLPGVDGIEFLKDLRTQEVRTPFVIFTGRGREEIAIEALNQGADFYLQKGGNPQAQYAELANFIRKAVERSRVDAALEESEQKYRKLVDEARMAIVVAQHGKIRFMNPYGLEIFGITAEQVQGMPIGELIHPEDQAMVLDYNQRRMSGETVPTIYTFRVIDKKGKTRTVEINVILTTWEGLPATLNLLHDITERVRAETALREREELYRSLAETSPAMIYLIDPDGHVRYVNSEGAQQLQQTPEAIVGKHLRELFPPVIAEQHLATLREVIETKATLHQEIQETFPTGCAWIDVRLTPVRDAEGTVTGVLGMSFDISQRKWIEEQLQRSESFLSDIFQSIQDGISVLDTKMRILRVNHAMEHWYPHQLPLVGKRCYEAYHGRDSPCEVCPTMQTLATRAPAHEVVPLTGPGRARIGWLDLFTFPLLDEETGDLKGVIEYVCDITDRKMMEEVEKKAFEQIEKNINQLSILNDHLRNPLAVIVGLADLEGGPTAEKILRQAKEIDRIITELDMGWLESEKIREFMRKHYGVVAGEPEEMR
jgi:PAS domain S-box-containing protein